MLKLRPTDNQGSVKDIVSFVLAASLLLLVGLGVFQRQAIVDYLKLRNYTPTAEIAQLATDSTMNDPTRRIFYVNNPVLQDKTEFKIDCPNGGGEKTIVLGCYHGGQNGIFLLDVDDPRLNGVKQVTAAHELLHAAYERLSGKERRDIDNLLQTYFDNELKDQRIKDTIEGYKKTEPNDLVNEMHSIFGTEIKQLPEALESYYARYFTDRAKIVAFADQYQSEFTSRQAAVKRDDERLAVIKEQITAGEAELSRLQDEISERQRDLQARQRAGDVPGYNAGVPGYNALIDRYNQLVRQVQSLVAEYNALVAERNSLASEIAELSNALNTNVEQINQ